MAHEQRRSGKGRPSHGGRLLVRLTVVAIAALAATSMIYAVRSAITPVEAAVSEIEHVHGLAIDPFDSAVLWIGTNSGLVRVRNGTEWMRIGRVRYRMMGFNGHPKEPGVLLTSGQPSPADLWPNPLGVKISRDGGQTWQPLSLVGEVGFHVMTISRADPRVLYGWSGSGRAGLHRSHDGGRSWEHLGNVDLGRVFYLAAHPANRAVVFAGTESGLFISEDHGKTWRAHPAPQLLNVPVTAIEAHPKDPDVIYAYASRQGLGLIRSEDGGKTWSPVGFSLGGRDAVGNLALDPANLNVLYFATFGGYVYRSADGGKTNDQWVARGRVLTAR
jgi:hypothetical protein